MSARLRPEMLSRYLDPFDRCAGLPFHYREDVQVGGRIWVFGGLAPGEAPFEAVIERVEAVEGIDGDRSSVAVFFRTEKTGGGRKIITAGTCTEVQGVQVLGEADDGESLHA